MTERKTIQRLPIEVRTETRPDEFPHRLLDHGQGVQILWKRVDEEAICTARLLGWAIPRFFALELTDELKPLAEGDSVTLEFEFKYERLRMASVVLHRLDNPARALLLGFPKQWEILAGRKSFRYVVNLECNLIRVDDPHRTPFTAVLSDISTGGCRIRTDMLLELDRKVLIDLVLPNGKRIRRLLATVRNADIDEEGTSVGLQFDQSMYITLAKITSYLDTLADDEEAPWIE